MSRASSAVTTGSRATRTAVAGAAGVVAGVLPVRRQRRRAAPTKQPDPDDKTEEELKLETLHNEFKSQHIEVQHSAVSRHIFDLARKLHKRRPSFHARRNTSERSVELAHVVWKEICDDIRHAARTWLSAMKMVQHMQEGAAWRFARRVLANEKLDRARGKVFAIDSVCGLFTKTRDSSSAARLWRVLWRSPSLPESGDATPREAASGGDAHSASAGRLSRLFHRGDSDAAGLTFATLSGDSFGDASPGREAFSPLSCRSARRYFPSLPNQVTSPAPAAKVRASSTPASLASGRGLEHY